MLIDNICRQLFCRLSEKHYLCTQKRKKECQKFQFADLRCPNLLSGTSPLWPQQQKSVAPRCITSTSDNPTCPRQKKVSMRSSTSTAISLNIHRRRAISATARNLLTTTKSTIS